MTDGGETLPLFSQPAHDSTPSADPSHALRADSSLNAAITTWGEHLEKTGRSINTVKAFSSDLRLLAKYISAGKEIGTIGTHDLKNFLEWMQTQRNAPCSPKTYSRRVTSLKSFFRWLKETGVLCKDPAIEVPQESVLSPLPEVLTPNEMQIILELADSKRRDFDPDARPYTLVALLLESGIKKSECLNIHLNHIDLYAPQGPTLFVRYANVQKRYRERKIIVSESWVASYEEYLAQYKPVETLFPYSPRRLEYLLEDLSAESGLEKHLSFNMCRWSCALNDYRNGLDANKIRQKLGISKIQWREVGNKLHRLAAQYEAD